MRETTLRYSENHRVIVPNSRVSSQVLVNANHTDDLICKFIDIGILAMRALLCKLCRKK